MDKTIFKLLCIISLVTLIKARTTEVPIEVTTELSSEERIRVLETKLEETEESLKQLSTLVTDIELVFGERLRKLEERAVQIEVKNEQQDSNIAKYGFNNDAYTVSFAAYLSGAVPVLYHGDTVVFDTMISSHGTNSFSTVCGTFRAPIHGIYYFTVNFITDTQQKNTNLDIMVNGHRKCIAYADGSHRHNTGVCSIIVELQPGDTVHVEHEDPHGDGGSLYGGQYATFSGFLYRPLF